MMMKSKGRTLRRMIPGRILDTAMRRPVQRIKSPMTRMSRMDKVAAMIRMADRNLTRASSRCKREFPGTERPSMLLPTADPSRRKQCPDCPIGTEIAGVKAGQESGHLFQEAAGCRHVQVGLLQEGG